VAALSTFVIVKKIMALQDKIKSNPALKKLVMWMLTSEQGIRPRWWVRTFMNPFYHKKGKGSVVFGRARMDVMPFNHFSMGNNATIEDFTFVNNGMGPVSIGDWSFIGAMNVIIGPVTIGNHIMTAQNVVMSGLNHGFSHVNTGFRYQPCTTSPISIGDGCWIGANVVITAGVTVGQYCVIAAGSVVTKDVPPYTIVAGNPAKPLKQFNHQTQTWDKITAA
jgi:acetyltransferase-like isoleucine patch superfamily enzyme